MTEHTRGLRLGRFTIGFLGVIALAALLTGAVAAAGAPGHAPDNSRTTVSAATGSGSPTAIATEKSEASEGATEAPRAPTAPTTLTSAPTSGVAGAACNPSLDKAEDQAEDQTQDEAEANEGETNGVEASSEPKAAPEASEPSGCTSVVQPVKPDSDDAHGSAVKTGVMKSLFNDGFEPGQGDHKGSFGQGH